jgi:hypothetical protein
MRGWWIALGAVLAGLVAVVAINCSSIMLSLAIVFAEPGAPTPALIEGVELNWNDESFPTFLASTFSVGTSTSDLIAQLEGDGFEIGPGNHASRQWGPSWCSWVMDVDWSESDGLLTEITGRYAPVCV